MRVLIVDDSHASRAMAVALVHEVAGRAPSSGEGPRSISIFSADCGVAALQVLAEREIDLLLVDMHLPDLTGLDVLRFWQQRGKKGNARALVVSSLVSDVDRARATAAGANGFLPKPLTETALAHALDHVEEKAR